MEEDADPNPTLGRLAVPVHGTTGRNTLRFGMGFSDSGGGGANYLPLTSASGDCQSETVYLGQPALGRFPLSLP